MLLTTSLIAGCAVHPSGPETTCPVWTADNTYYPSEKVIQAMTRNEKEQVAEINQEVETFCN